MKTAGRQVEVGIGIEATAGTAVTPTSYFEWDTLTMQSVSDKIMLNSARGIRNKASASIIDRQYGKGDIEFSPTVGSLPYMAHLALGTMVSALHSGETTVYDHTATVNNVNASMPTATLVVKQGSVDIEKYTNTVVDTWSLTLDKDFAKFKATMLAGFPTSGSATPSYVKETHFTRNDLTVQFGTTLSLAGAATATPLIDVEVNGANNVLVDDAFLSGSTEPAAGGFIAGPLEVKGSYTLQFADTVELAKYQQNTLNAMIVTLTGAAIGSAANEQIVIKLGKLVLTKEPLTYNIDGVIHLKQEFEVQYDATDKEISIIVTNADAGTNY